MSNAIAAATTVETLDQLRSTVEAFAARAEKLDSDYRVRSARERQRHTAALEEQARESASALAQAEAEFEAARRASADRYEQRKARIGRAYQTSKDKRLQAIDDSVGARKYDAQKRMLQAERDRESGLAAANAQFEQFKRDLATEQERLAGLERDALTAFRGYPSSRRSFLKAYDVAQAPAAESETQLLAKMRDLSNSAVAALGRLRSAVLFRLFRYIPAWFVVALAPLGAVPLLQHSGNQSLTYPAAGAAAAAIAFGALLLRFVGSRKARPEVENVCRSLAAARHAHDAAQTRAEAHWRQEHERIRTEFTSFSQNVEQQLKQAVSAAGQERVACRMSADERTVRITAAHERLADTRLRRLHERHREELERLRRAADARAAALTRESEDNLSRMKADWESQWHTLKTEWKAAIEPLFQYLAHLQAASDRLFPDWQQLLAQGWEPPAEFGGAARFGQLRVDLEQLCGAGLHAELTVPTARQFHAPLCLQIPLRGSVLFETKNSGQKEVVGALNTAILRLLTVTPPGRVVFTVLDPVGLGQNFAGVMHMADYEEQIIGSRIWTQSNQIEEKLADLNEHMEKVIQMYLRNEYQTISEYNRQAGVIAEKYHFLVVADFPANFTDVAARRLLSIAASGARCGVYTLIHWDHRHPLPQDFIPDELRKNSFCIRSTGGQFTVQGRSLPGTQLLLDAPPAPEQATQLVHQIGQASRDSSRVEVPFDHVAPAESETWTQDTTAELQVPIGRTGATKLQYLAIGKGTRQHALIAGKTGSGKSTLFHVMITNLALWCSPEQVEFYLVDFKKGVEFKCYATRRLPHARVVAIESDREFGLSVLQRVDDELKRRGDLFRKLGVQDIPGYKRAGGTEPIPRSLLIIDEFQEFFVEDDKIAQTASLLLDRIVRQGRAFGIHVLLGSQTLGGAYTVARTTLGQMVIRIALQCNEADAYLIMDDNNPAPRLLSRPGEGIYNDSAGAIEGNSPFQVVWLPEYVRDERLAQVRARADRQDGKYPGPIVFEGNAPADVTENALLREALAVSTPPNPVAPRIWMGAPNSIKGPTEAVFYRQSGNNLLIVGQREEAVLAIVSLGIIALAAQFLPGPARIILADSNPPGSPPRDYFETVLRSIQRRAGSPAQPAITPAKPSDVPEILSELSREMARRIEDTAGETHHPIFLFINGLQRFPRLRYEDDFSFSSGGGTPENPSAQLSALICEGARVGIHVIATCDTYNNVNRFLSRKTLSEFEMRVLFQMSTNDSASLIDNPKAGALGLHRALFYNSQEGYLETFRPYALPPPDWLDHLGKSD